MGRSMPNRISHNVSLTPELSRFIRGQIASGRYQSTSEAVRAALRLLQNQEPPQAAQPRPARAPRGRHVGK
jgi:Arc/MetJ-type ribon-helix-helix transcriptional regulator